MGDAENALPPSKKRAAGRELSRDNPGLDDDEDSTEQPTGTFRRASDEVLATRKIVKVRRKTASAPSSNPFAGIRLVPSNGSSAGSSAVTTDTAASEKKDSDKEKDNATRETEKEDKQPEVKIDETVSKATAEKTYAGKLNSDEKGETEAAPSGVGAVKGESIEDKENSMAGNGDKVENEKPVTNETRQSEETVGAYVESQEKDGSGKSEHQSADGKTFSSFQQLSTTQNAFTGLAGTGFSSSAVSFGPVAKDGSAFGNTPSTFGFGLSTNGSSLLNLAGSTIASKSEGNGFPALQEVTVETGEENEKAVFSADSVLFEFLDGVWKERGKGELRVNVSTSGEEQARLIMRAKGNYRLILNASLYPDMKLTNMDKRGVTFACMNSVSEAKDGLSTVALKFKDASIVEQFHAAVTTHKGKSTTSERTPENSPQTANE